mgnify:FL=1
MNATCHKIIAMFKQCWPARYSTAQVVRELDTEIEETRDALLELVRAGEIVGHEQNGKLIYYAKEPT